MQISLQLSNGAYVHGDHTTRASLNAQGMSDDEIDLAFDGIEDALENIGNAGYISLEINGQRRIFNPRHIMWVDFDRED